MNALVAGSAAAVSAFREQAVTRDGLADRDASTFAARLLQYELNWRFYQNTAYRDINKFAPTLRKAYNLYPKVFCAYSPANRLGEFYVSRLMGGLLDPEAIESPTEKSALPIVSESETIQPACHQLWRHSVWQVNKAVWTRLGAVMGDVGLAVVDEPDKGRVRLQVIDPRRIRDVRLDPVGNVVGYLLEYRRDDPLDPNYGVLGAENLSQVTYNEEVFRVEGTDTIVYRTYRDGEPYAWPGSQGAEWEIDYGFVPMVFTSHIRPNPDSPWGVAEMYAGLSRFMAVDNTASILQRQLYKKLKSPRLIAGVPSMEAIAAGDDTDDLTFYTVPQSDIDSIDLTSDLPLQDALQVLQSQMDDLEKMYPELRFAPTQPEIDVSGRALEIARQDTEEKVWERRSVYDDGLVRAHMMAFSIASMPDRRYKGYDFPPNAYKDGLLDHRIGWRPVFRPTPTDEATARLQFWQAAVAATTAGAPPTVFFRYSTDWTEAMIDDYLAEKAADAADAVNQAGALAKATAPPPQPQQPPAQQPQPNGAAQ